MISKGGISGQAKPAQQQDAPCIWDDCIYPDCTPAMGCPSKPLEVPAMLPNKVVKTPES